MNEAEFVVVSVSHGGDINNPTLLSPENIELVRFSDYLSLMGKLNGEVLIITDTSIDSASKKHVDYLMTYDEFKDS